MIVASCGHEISLEWYGDEKSFIECTDYDNGQPVITGAVVCEECRKMHERKNLIVKNEQQRSAWLSKNSR